VNAATWEVFHRPSEPAELLLTAVDPQGGLRAVLADGTLKAYTAIGETRWTLPVSLSAPVNVLGVDARGHTLLLAVGDTRFGPATAEGLWVDDAGQPGQPFLALAQVPGGSHELMPQATEGLFLAVNHGGGRTWAAAFESLKPEGHPAPAWLSQEAERPLLRLPGGKGYFRPSADPASGSVCQRQAELIGPTGASCGTLHFPPPVMEGSLCEPLKLGADGTVVEPLGAKYWGSPGREGPDDPQQEFGLHCMVRSWPRLLQ
jgi:hypothetical protein